MYNTLMQPGETITPGGQPSPTPPAPPQKQWPADSNTAYAPETQSKPAPEGGEINWTASEYIAHHKTANWYVLLAIASVIVAGLVLLLTGDKLSAGVIVLVAAVFGISAARQPRTLRYAVDHYGIRIGDKSYAYTDFKSFSVIEEDAIYSVMLLPMKRFMPGISMYYPPDQEEDILEVLADYLPHETRQEDMVDRVVRKLRF